MKMIRQKKFENIKVVPNQIGSIPIKILVDFQKDHLDLELHIFYCKI